MVIIQKKISLKTTIFKKPIKYNNFNKLQKKSYKKIQLFF